MTNRHNPLLLSTLLRRLSSKHVSNRHCFPTRRQIPRNLLSTRAPCYQKSDSGHSTPDTSNGKQTLKYHFTMPDIVDDKSPHVIPFILERYEKFRESSSNPFFIGLNGVQGIGKSTLVESLAATLRSSPYSLNTLTLSIDDFYLPFADLQALASEHPHNPLLQQRGQPSTHDIQLALEVCRALKARQHDIRIPGYDKGARRGRGDRKPEADWKVVNASSDASKGTLDVVIFEGWCVGFRAISHHALEELWTEARRDLLSRSSLSSAQRDAALRDTSTPLTDEAFSGRLGALALRSITYVNGALASQGYEELFTQYLDAFVYLDAEDPFYVYEWRGQQEDELREQKGEGGAMTNDEVNKFVDGYFPAYEVYVDRVRAGVFSDLKDDAEKQGAQMRLVIRKDRSVLRSEVV